MSTLKLDTNGDLAVENNSLVILDDLVEETAQRLATKFKFFLGEWHLEPRAGFPLFDRVLIKSPDLADLRALYREAILEDEAVNTLESLTFDLDSATRVLSVSYEATLIDGSVLTVNDFILEDYR
jgi:hypothetical protein